MPHPNRVVQVPSERDAESIQHWMLASDFLEKGKPGEFYLHCDVRARIVEMENTVELWRWLCESVFMELNSAANVIVVVAGYRLWVPEGDDIGLYIERCTMKTALERYNVDGLWHFTDKSNLKLVEQHSGLLSLAELQRRGVVIPAPGGNQWSHDADRMKGLDDYIHLAFIDNHPMLYVARQEGRIIDPIWLKIDLAVVLEDGVRFTNDVSNKSGVVPMSSDEALHSIDFEVLFTRTDWTNPEIMARRRVAEKSEILIPKTIPISRIVGYRNG